MLLAGGGVWWSQAWEEMREFVDRTGMQVKRFPLTIQWQGGRREVVWPLVPRVQTATAIFTR